MENFCLSLKNYGFYYIFFKMFYDLLYVYFYVESFGVIFWVCLLRVFFCYIFVVINFFLMLMVLIFRVMCYNIFGKY